MVFIDITRHLFNPCIHFTLHSCRYVATVQLKGNLTPARMLPVEKIWITGRIHNKQARVPVTGTDACKGNLKHLLGHCNQESVLSVFSIQLNKKNLLLLTII